MLKELYKTLFLSKLFFTLEEVCDIKKYIITISFEENYNIQELINKIYLIILKFRASLIIESKNNHKIIILIFERNY